MEQRRRVQICNIMFICKLNLNYKAQCTPKKDTRNNAVRMNEKQIIPYLLK